MAVGRGKSGVEQGRACSHLRTIRAAQPEPGPTDASRLAELRFRALAEAIPVIVWTADAEGSIDWYSRRWYEYTGQSPEEAQGWGWQAVPHPDDFLTLMRKWPEAIASGAPFEMECRMRRRDGVYHWFLCRAESVRDPDGTVLRWYGSTIDIDQQKTALDRTKRVGQTLQEIFLPTSLPQRPTLRMDAVYLPAERDAPIGGDWFDAFETPTGESYFDRRRRRHGWMHRSSSGGCAGDLHPRVPGFQSAHARTGRPYLTPSGLRHDRHRAGRLSRRRPPRDDPCSAGHPTPMLAVRGDTLAQILPGGGLRWVPGFRSTSKRIASRSKPMRS